VNANRNLDNKINVTIVSPFHRDRKEKSVNSENRPLYADAIYYSFAGQNCVWWATIMLKQSGISVPGSTYDKIKAFNHGIGEASKVISGARSASQQDLVPEIIGPNLTDFCL
jgi:hypothetical protein